MRKEEKNEHCLHRQWYCQKHGPRLRKQRTVSYVVILTTYAGVIHVSPVFQRLSGGCGALSPLDGFPSTTGISRSKLRQGNRTRCCSDDMRPGLPGNVFGVHATTHGGNGRGRTSDLYLIRVLLCQLSYITIISAPRGARTPMAGAPALLF